MKYDILNPFKKFLLEKTDRKNTALTYFAAVEKLFREIQFDSLRQISKEWILGQMAVNFKTKNEYSAAKNGLKKLKEFDNTLNLPTEEEFREISMKKRNFSRRPKKTIYLNPTQRKINQIKDKKLKYAYRLAVVSGLRVFEIAELEADDFAFEDEKIYVRVRDGKGGESAVVECMPDKYLSEHLPEFLEVNSGNKIFYSANHMKHCAKELGMECHDLRRIFAITLRDELKKQMPLEEANRIVQERMRHERFSTTKRYLFNRKLKLKYEKKDMPEGSG